LWNNSVQASASQIFVDHVDNDGNDIDIFLALLNSGDTVVIQSTANSNNYQKWLVSGTPTIQTNYIQIPVTLDTSTYSFANNDPVLFVMSQIGPQGPQGPQGAAGATGSQGAQGATGPQGPQGETGPQGTQGPQGATGPQGPQGTNGIIGMDGAQGPQGPQGAQGPQGSTGAQGPTGPQGSTGPQGAQGAAAPVQTTTNLFTYLVMEVNP
jgi:hypothetical protein